MDLIKFLLKWEKIIRKNWDKSWFWPHILIKIYFRVFGGIYRKLFLRENILKKEWEVLILLDACRYDLLKEKLSKYNKKYSFKIEKMLSVGSCTPEFLNRTFKGRKFNDILYITANPFVDILVKDSFSKVIPVWKIAWSKKYDTVLPESVVLVSKEIFKRYSNKKLIIHFMQPHYPFIMHPKIKGTLSKLRNVADKGKNLGKDINPWNLLMEGEYKSEEVWNAYKSNYDYVLPYALELVNFFLKKGKKVVITSDHGNIIKKIGKIVFVAGHPCKTYFRDLVTVPWVEFYKKK